MNVCYYVSKNGNSEVNYTKHAAKSGRYNPMWSSITLINIAFHICLEGLMLLQVIGI